MHIYKKYHTLHTFYKAAFLDSSARNKDSRRSSYDKWSGTATWEEACKLANEGWLEGIDYLKKHYIRLQNELESRDYHKQLQYKVYGHQIEIPAYLSNHPDCFIHRQTHTSTIGSKIIKIVVSIAHSSSVPKEAILQRGARIAALIDYLEHQGYRVEIVANFKATSSYNKSFELDIVIKHTDAPLDLSNLCFCLAHAAMSRRLCFSIAEQLGWSDAVSSYGRPTDASEQGDLYFEANYARSMTVQKSIKLIEQRIRDLGFAI